METLSLTENLRRKILQGLQEQRDRGTDEAKLIEAIETGAIALRLAESLAAAVELKP